MGCIKSKSKREAALSLTDLTRDTTHIILIGLDGAGKSTLFYRLKVNVTLTTYPTVGYNVHVACPIKGLKFTIWDIGGQEKLRTLWSNYYTACKAVLFMVDSSDHRRFGEARKELHEALKHPAMPEYVPLLILANKQDMESACTPEQLASYLDLHQLGSHSIKVLPTVVTKNEGIIDAMKELKQMLKHPES